MIIVKLFILSFHHHGFKNINANHSIQKVQLIWEMKEDKIIYTKTLPRIRFVWLEFTEPHMLTRSSQSIKIIIDLSINKSIKIGKSDLINIDCIDQSVETDDTLVSFISSSRFYRFHRIISEGTSVLLFIQKWKLISCKQWICWQHASCNNFIESWRIKQLSLFLKIEKKILSFL